MIVYILIYIWNSSVYTKKNSLKSNIIFEFVKKLNKYIDNDPGISFWDYYEIFNQDFLKIKNDKNEWKVYNTISSLLNKLRDIEIFTTIYIYKTGKNCKHNLRKNCKGTSIFPLNLNINGLNESYLVYKFINKNQY